MAKQESVHENTPHITAQITSRKDNEYPKMIGELLGYDGTSGNRELTNWEIDFLENIEVFASVVLTGRQQQKLEEIWQAVFGGSR